LLDWIAALGSARIKAQKLGGDVLARLPSSHAVLPELHRRHSLEAELACVIAQVPARQGGLAGRPRRLS